ncbi:D-threo-aldose 1-dehydrogenase [Verticillium alfalfae VaMs.102]|uniref:D-threo-aldose 1-dehydrogenase n=1 Tax=Verticillium alfalfae (strain VaMs.102 / ATCC MYA-4576 / FGSC 10136) TaxID=526221 RepID=C9SX07_VERA1|nr:D-threo-aldose 1-dehydrogenase [Verticillium alfalfae VaMs.102]EEY23548.1 D-threo-aldose 1-dehydrogenase [Verticillium alfalfae VaMs.102]
MTALPPLSSVIPPLILGTATFNIQYHPNPDFNNLSLPVLRAAFAANITAIDTSPYYGPSELLVGAALSALAPPRDSLFLITKAGRVGPSAFDYSPAHIRHSVHRSLARLHTPYLDLVHCHDVEFVSPAEVLAAVRELRALRSQGLLRYVGISGYPPAVLAALAEMILARDGRAPRRRPNVLLAIDAGERPAPAVRTAEEAAAVALDERFRKLVEESMWPALGGWRNYSWESPQADFVNTRSEFGVLPTDLDSAPCVATGDDSNLLVEAQRDLVSTESVAPVLTGAA